MTTLHRFVTGALWIACAGCPAKDAVPTPAPAPTSPAAPDTTADAAVATPIDAAPALDPALAARLPADGLMMATIEATSEAELSIFRLDRAGLHLLWRGPGADRILWADERTLIAMNGGTSDHRDVTIRTFVDVGEPTTQEIANDGGPAPGVPVPGATLVRGREGEVWLRRCMDKDIVRVDDNNVVGCEQTVYRRVHPPSTEPDTTTRPATSTRAAARSTAAVKPPAGITLKRTTVTRKNELDKTDKHKVLKCTSPAGTALIPDVTEPTFEVYEVLSMRWVREKPPIFGVTSRTRSPMGEKATFESFYIACDPTLLDSYREIADGIWAQLERIQLYYPDGSPGLHRGVWHFYVDETELVQVPGLELSMP